MLLAFLDLVNQKTLSTLLTWSIAIVFFLFISVFLLNFRTFFRPVVFSKKTVSPLVFIFFLALSLRMVLSPQTHLDFYNEWIYMEGAQSMVLNGNYGRCFFGGADDCFSWAPISHPPGVPFIFAIAFFLFGASGAVAINTNIFFGSASVILIFMIGSLLSKREKIGLYSALFFSLVPMHIRYSGTAILDPVSMFFQLVAVYAFLLALRVNEKKTWLLFILAFFFSIQTRPESPIILIIFLSGYFLLKPDTLKKPALSWRYLPLGAFLLPYIYHLANGVARGVWKEGKPASSFSIDHVIRNFTSYTGFWLNPDYQLPVFPILFLAGAFYLFGTERKTFWFLTSWFALFLVFFIPYHVDPATFPEMFRYMLSAYLPFCLFMGYGVYYFSTIQWKAEAFIVIFAATLMTFYLHLPSIRYIDEVRQAEIEIMKEVDEQIDDKCYVIGYSSLFSIQKNVIFPFMLTRGEVGFDQLREVTDCLYLFKGFAARHDDGTEQILKRCPRKLIAGKEVFLNKPAVPYTYAFYKLDLEQCSR